MQGTREQADVPSHSIDSTEYNSVNGEPCWREQGLQGELQAAPVLIAEGERPQGQGKYSAMPLSCWCRAGAIMKGARE